MKIIDLHGLRHEEAKGQVELFINDNWGDCIKIITGNSEAMKNIACEVIQEYNLDYVRSDFWGYIIIKEH